jgi:hypothetical protein
MGGKVIINVPGGNIEFCSALYDYNSEVKGVHMATDCEK